MKRLKIKPQTGERKCHRIKFTSRLLAKTRHFGDYDKETTKKQQMPYVRQPLSGRIGKFCNQQCRTHGIT